MSLTVRRPRCYGLAGLFPPAFIAATATGPVSGHLWRGMSRADCNELGDIIDDGISNHDDTAEILISGARA